MLINRTPIGTVCFMSGIDFIPTGFLRCSVDMVAFCERHIAQDNRHIEYVHTPYSFHAKARNDLASQRIGGPDAWTFMLDTDVSFTPRSLKTLLETMYSNDLDVVCGVYFKKNPPHLPVIMDHEGKWFTHVREIVSTEPFQIGGGGGGCLLIRNRVFDRIAEELEEDPFDSIYYTATEEDPDNGPLSEDLSFFKRCQALGIEVWCDPAVQCGHMGMVDIGRPDFDHCREAVMREADGNGVPAYR